MSDFFKKPIEKRITITSLFNDTELKLFCKKCFVFTGIMEVLILLGCWVSQLGTNEYNHFGNVDIPFPWKTYFLLAFLMPVAIIFLLGVFITAFNKYVHGVDSTSAISEDKEEMEEMEHKGMVGKFQTFLNITNRIPFLLSLVLLAIGAGILYRIEDIIIFLSNLGLISAKLLLIVSAVALAIGAVLSVTWMILNYKLKKKDMEYRYRCEVMERTGMVMLEDKTIVNPEKNALPHGSGQKRIIPLLSGSSEGEKDHIDK